VRSLLQFVGIWGAVIAFSAGTLFLALWALSIDDDPGDEKAASSLLWSFFWPAMWFYLWLTGRNSTHVGRGRARHSALKSQVGMREQSAQRFRTIREAKEYLADVITKEAERDGTPLTDVERKMLFFTETGWTLPDMKAISSEFDRDYDQDKYEQKISSIITRIRARFAGGDPDQAQMTWDLALEKLGEGDHYLLVLADAANPVRRGARHNLKMVIVALVFLVLGCLDIWFRHWLRDH